MILKTKISLVDDKLNSFGIKQKNIWVKFSIDVSEIIAVHEHMDDDSEDITTGQCWIHTSNNNFLIKESYDYVNELMHI